LWQYTEFHYCDRYNYLVAPVVLAAVVTLLPRHSAVPWCLGALALLMAVITWRDGCVWRSDRALWHRCLASSPVNPKSFQVASGDALMRDDAGDLEYIAIRLREERASLPLDGERVDNTAALLEAHACILREDYDRGIPILAELLQRERRSGRRLQFMRGDNYRYIFEEDAPLATFFMKRRIPNK
jgi:hypothetical protein